MSILRFLKRRLYFFFANYFAFFARIVLRRWQPTIVTVIGSSGKTTLLHLLEAQLGDKAVYSHKANSAFGIPFHILGLERKNFSLIEWPMLLILAPFKMLRTLPRQKLYITEADAERPGEGQLLAKVLEPNILVWLSLGTAHSGNYDRLVQRGGSERGLNGSIEEAIAHEFGLFPALTKSLIISNWDNRYIVKEVERSRAQKIGLSQHDIREAKVGANRVVFETVAGETFSVPALVPKEVGLSVLAVAEVLKQLNEPIDPNFTQFTLPPSRSSVFDGKNNTTLIDSTYNATIDGMRSMLDVFADYPAAGPKWLVLGDMVEQGKSERAEHELLAEFIKKVSPQRVVLVGPRLREYTMPALMKSDGKIDPQNVYSFMMPAEALECLQKNMQGGETILFKGARFLEGVVERMLAHPADAEKLCRRERVWVERRKKWGV